MCVLVHVAGSNTLAPESGGLAWCRGPNHCRQVDEPVVRERITVSSRLKTEIEKARQQQTEMTSEMVSVVSSEVLLTHRGSLH